MKQILIAIVCLFMGAGAASAQTVDTKVCDILAHPKDFGRRFRGQEDVKKLISFSFRDFYF
jgi:hypothetical protein